MGGRGDVNDIREGTGRQESEVTPKRWARVLRGIVTILRKVGRGSQAWWIRVQSLCVLILVQSLTKYVTLGKSCYLSGPQLAFLCTMGSQGVTVIIKWIHRYMLATPSAAEELALSFLLRKPGRKIRVREDVGKLELSCAAGGNVKCRSHCGEQF